MEIGQKRSTMAKFLPGRTDVSLKKQSLKLRRRDKKVERKNRKEGFG
jgi:hypothetical protein